MGIHNFGRDSHATDRLNNQGRGNTFDYADRDRFTRTERTPRRYRRRTPNLGYGFFGALIMLAFVGIIGYNVAQYTVAGSATCTVIDKNFAESSDGHGSSHGVYRIATSDCGVMEVRDNWLRAKFNSADTYYAIKVGGTYRFDYTGFRIPIFSQFPGIISATSVAGDKGTASATQG